VSRTGTGITVRTSHGSVSAARVIIATGYATIGRIGFEGRYDYGAVGTSVILASRLSSAAKADEILISQRVMAAVEDHVEVEQEAVLELKGFSSAMTAHAVRRVSEPQPT